MSEALPSTTITAIIQQKHDTQANWEINGVDYIPLAGEIIVYDPDNTFTYPRMKIGDGSKTVEELEFIQAGNISVDLTDYAKKTEIPTKISDLTNDEGYLTSIPSEYVTETELNSKGYLTSYTETDPTVPDWAKKETKPTYTKSEIAGLENVDNTADIDKKVKHAVSADTANTANTATKATQDASGNIITDTYATKAEIPTELPNPYNLTINGTSYDGSEQINIYTDSRKSVLAYGAKGDGETNDTAAFQAALAGNRVVFVPGGTYKLDGTLTIEENRQLELSQDTVLRFYQTSGNCIQMQRSAWLKGNHATVFVQQEFKGHILHVSTDVDVADKDESGKYIDNNNYVPPWTTWDPQWKTARYVTDINICKQSFTEPDYKKFNYARTLDDIGGVAVYINCDNEDPTRNMWGVNMSGLRIAGAFSHGIYMFNEDGLKLNDASKWGWNHEARIEAVIDACEIGAELYHCRNTYLSIVFQPRPTENKKVYAMHGIKLVASENVDMSGSRVWDWNSDNSLVKTEVNGEFPYQHIALYDDCYGAIINDYTYYLYGDTRSRIYTNTPSNLEQMTILQEPITRWFKPIDGEPYFNNGKYFQKLALNEDLNKYFIGDQEIPAYTNVKSPYSINTGCNNQGEQISSSNILYIHPKEIAKGDVIRIQGLDFSTGIGGGLITGAFFYYKTNGTFRGLVNIGSILEKSTTGSFYNGEADFSWDNDRKLLTIEFTSDPGGMLNAYNYGFSAKYAAGYTLETVVMTVNQEIKYKKVGMLADTIKVPGENVYLTGPGGIYKLSIKDENGTLEATKVTVTE